MLLNPASSDFDTKNLDIIVGTNYLNGYKLYINATFSSLTNSDYVSTGGSSFYIPTLDSAVSTSSFPANYWGYRISSSSSSGSGSGSSGSGSGSSSSPGNSAITSTTDFYPFASGTLISSSSTATTRDDTTLTFASKIDYSKPSGTYTNTFNLVGVINPVTYTITYADNTGDSSVANLPTPNPESGIIAGTIIPVSDTTPERTGYTFKSWCKGAVSENGTVCTGSEFNAGESINIEAAEISDTTFTLNAVWTTNGYIITYGTVAGIASVSLDNTSCTTALSSGGCTKNLLYNQTYNLVATPATGYSFTSWSAGAKGSITDTSTASTKYTVGLGASTITPSTCGTISGNMQSFSPTATTCTTGTLTDSRDTQKYTIAKIADTWWMTRNLAIGCNGSGNTYGSAVSGKNLTSTLSNVSSSYSTPTALLSAASASTRDADYLNGRMQCNATYGAYYNYVAASAGTITETSNLNPDVYNICPKKWTLPSSTEMRNLVNSIGANPTIFSPAAGANWYLGNYEEIGYGKWWASDTTTDVMRRLYLTYIEESNRLTFSTGDLYVRNHGMTVRCILK